MRRRAVSSASSSPFCGSSASSSATAWRRNSSSALTASSAATAAATALRALPMVAHVLRVLARCASLAANASSTSRCPLGFNRPLSSCCPCSSTSVSESARSTSPEQRLSLTHAVLRPSMVLTRRRMSSSPPGNPASSSTAWARWPCGKSNHAVTSPCSAPCRTSSARPRQPSTKPSESNRIDLPAPVSPVSTLRPGWNVSSNRSMISMSLISSPRSICPPERNRRGGADYSHWPLIIWR